MKSFVFSLYAQPHPHFPRLSPRNHLFRVNLFFIQTYKNTSSLRPNFKKSSQKNDRTRET